MQWDNDKIPDRVGDILTLLALTSRIAFGSVKIEYRQNGVTLIHCGVTMHSNAPAPVELYISSHQALTCFSLAEELAGLIGGIPSGGAIVIPIHANQVRGVEFTKRFDLGDSGG